MSEHPDQKEIQGKLRNLISLGSDATGSAIGGVTGFLIGRPVGAVVGGVGGVFISKALRELGDDISNLAVE